MQPDTGRIRVLHVDDDPDLRDLVATSLEREADHLTVETAESADAGLARLADAAVDCVVSDYDMPGKNGLAFLEAVRANYPELPFILFTGKGSEEVASEAISAGVTDYLQKETGTSQYAVLANRIANAVEQYRARRALEDSQQRLSLFFEQSPLGVIQWTVDFEFARMNDAAETVLGYDAADLAGRSWESIVPDSEREAVATVVADLLENRGGYHSVNENVTAEGERIVCEWHNRVVTDDAGDVLAIYSLFQDVTERERRERRFRAVFNNTYTFMGLLDTDGTVLEANKTALGIGDLDRAAVVGEPVWEAPWFADSQANQQAMRTALETARAGERFRDELRLDLDDEAMVIDFSMRPVTDERGEVTAVVPEGRDVTDRKRHARRLETLLDTLPGMVYRCQNERGWPMEAVRGEVEHLTGYDAGTIERNDVSWGTDVVHPDDREWLWERVQAAVEDRETYEVTYHIRTAGGITKEVWERGTGVFADDGELNALEGFICDVPERDFSNG